MGCQLCKNERDSGNYVIETDIKRVSKVRGQLKSNYEKDTSETVGYSKAVVNTALPIQRNQIDTYQSNTELDYDIETTNRIKDEERRALNAKKSNMLT